MHARRRILICRVGFVAFCVLPTLVVCGWLASLSTGEIAVPSKEAWEQELTSRLGLLVEIERVDGSRLENVRLVDPETRSLVARAAAIEVSSLAEGWIVSAEGASIEVGQLKLAARTLDHRILRRPPSAADGEGNWSIRLSPSDLTLRGGSRSQTLRRLEGTLHCSADSTKLAVDFHLPAAPAAAQPGRFTVWRKRATSAPETEWYFNSGGHSLPCAIFQDLEPALARLGDDCSFGGEMQWVESASRHNGELAGAFTGVDLDALVSEQFAHQLSGLADMEIARAVIEEGKLVELAGALRAARGAVSPSLLAAAAEHLRLEWLADPAPPESGQAVSFRELAIAFALDGRSLRLRGDSRLGDAGVVLSSAQGPLLAAPPNHATAAVNLLRMLVPENQHQVPATRQTDVLVGLLPVPDLAPARTAALPTHTPTRLRTSGPEEAAPVLHEPGLR